MFLFKSHKTLSHKQSSVIGFVLAVMSILVSVILIYGLPFLLGFLRGNGVLQLDLYLIAMTITLFFSIQGLLLFGFPLFYAKDKKSHMTGFQILIYAQLWMLVMTAIIVVLSLALFQSPLPVNVGDIAL